MLRRGSASAFAGAWQTDAPCSGLSARAVLIALPAALSAMAYELRFLDLVPDVLLNVLGALLDRPARFALALTCRELCGRFRDKYYRGIDFVLDCIALGYSSLAVWAVENEACVPARNAVKIVDAINCSAHRSLQPLGASLALNHLIEYANKYSELDGVLGLGDLDVYTAVLAGVDAPPEMRRVAYFALGGAARFANKDLFKILCSPASPLNCAFREFFECLGESPDVDFIDWALSLLWPEWPEPQTSVDTTFNKTINVDDLPALVCAFMVHSSDSLEELAVKVLLPRLNGRPLSFKNFSIDYRLTNSQRFASFLTLANHVDLRDWKLPKPATVIRFEPREGEFALSIAEEHIFNNDLEGAKASVAVALRNFFYECGGYPDRLQVVDDAYLERLYARLRDSFYDLKVIEKRLHHFKTSAIRWFVEHGCPFPATIDEFLAAQSPSASTDIDGDFLHWLEKRPNFSVTKVTYERGILSGNLVVLDWLERLHASRCKLPAPAALAHLTASRQLWLFQWLKEHGFDMTDKYVKAANKQREKLNKLDRYL